MSVLAANDHEKMFKKHEYCSPELLKPHLMTDVVVREKFSFDSLM